MITVGITGGIGSGKTYVSKLFLHIGIPVYYADQQTKILYTTNKSLKNKLISTFGAQVYLPSGKINKTFLREILFSNSAARKKINQIVHPYVMEDFKNWCLYKKNVPYILKESALLFETGLFKTLDKTILIIAPDKLKKERIKKRDNISEKIILQKMATQLHDSEKEKFADFIIINDGKRLLLPQVLNIHEQLLKVNR